MNCPACGCQLVFNPSDTNIQHEFIDCILGGYSFPVSTWQTYQRHVKKRQDNDELSLKLFQDSVELIRKLQIKVHD